MGYRFLISDPQNNWQFSGTYELSMNLKSDSVFIKNPHDFKIEFFSKNPLLRR